MGLSHRLARLVAEPDECIVDAAALEWATWMVLDSVSVAIAGSRLARETTLRTANVFAALVANGRAVAWPIGRRLSPAGAAASNATAIHSIDFDDSYMAGGVKAHFSASIVPTALAVAEDEGRSGRDALNAIVRGFEVAARLGHLVSPSMVERWHPTGTLGVVGCAATTASLFGLDVNTTERALGLAADHAAGTRFCLAAGDATKSLHAAFAAHDGIAAATMARGGIDGPLGFFEGLKGYVESYTTAEAEAAWDDVGRGRPLIELNCTKFFPVMHALHAAVAVGLELAASHPVASSREIAEITVVQSTTHASFGAYWSPETELAARLSLPFAIGATLLEGACGVDQFRRSLLDDTEFRALVQRVRIEPSASIEQEYGSRVASEVRVRWTDGTQGSGFAADPLGFPERPALPAQRISKARALCNRVMSEAETDELIEMLRTIAEMPRLDSLADRLALVGDLRSDTTGTR